MKSADDAYETAKERIAAHVKKYSRYCYSGRSEVDEDDLLGIAYDAFMEAYRTYRRRKGKFLHYLSFVVSRRLRQELRRRLRRRSIAEMTTNGKSWWWNSRPESKERSLAAFAGPLSQDARDVIDVAKMTTDMGMKPAKARKTVEVVMSKAGWSCLRTDRAFEEVRQSLLKG